MGLPCLGIMMVVILLAIMSFQIRQFKRLYEHIKNDKSVKASCANLVVLDLEKFLSGLWVYEKIMIILMFIVAKDLCTCV